MHSTTPPPRHLGKPPIQPFQPFESTNAALPPSTNAAPPAPLSGIQEMLQQRLQEMSVPQTSSPLRRRATTVGEQTNEGVDARNNGRLCSKQRSFTNSVGTRTIQKKQPTRVDGLLDPASPPSPSLCDQVKKVKGQSRNSSTFEMREVARYNAKRGPECVVANPLTSETPKLTTKNLPDYLPMFFTLTDRTRKFCAKEAAQEVMKCIQYHGGTNLILESFIKIKAQLQDKTSKRWDRLFAALVLHPQSSPFLKAYIEQSGEDCNDFATRVIDRIWKQGVDSRDVIHALKLLTIQDLKEQRVEHLFREKNLSSSLCKVYGCYLLTKELEQVENILQDEFELAKKRLEGLPKEQEILEQKDGLLFLLCADVKVLREEMKTRVNDYSTLELEGQLDFANRRLEANALYFSDFAKGFFQQLYRLSLPEDFCSLLHMRRLAIQEKFPDKAEVFCGELLCLRIINPHLTNITKDPLKACILKDLGKILQNFSNQVDFEDKNSGPLLPFLKDMYHNFIEEHRAFVNKHSLLNS